MSDSINYVQSEGAGMRTTSDEILISLVVRPDAPDIIVVRTDEDDPRLIPGARRRLVTAAPNWAAERRGRSALGACQENLNRSEGAELARLEGAPAFLEALGLSCGDRPGGATIRHVEKAV